MVASLDALASRVEDMSVEQVEEVAVRVVSESGHVRGLEEITRVFDKGEVALILACGVRKYQEYQVLKGKTRGQGHHLLQAAAKEIWHKQKNADGGDSRLQVPIPGRGINKSAVRTNQAGGGRRGSNHKWDSPSK